MGMGGQGEGSEVSGVVAEVIQVPNYTYLRLTTKSGEAWAAVNATTGVEKGQSVSITHAALMTDFTSNTLKRTFASIWFGQLDGAAAAGATPVPASASAPAAGGAMARPGSSATAAALAAIEKADGPLGLRVKDVFSDRKALAGKTVRVRGLVTKVTAVQGLNYVHVKDASGTGLASDDDLTVVTQGAVKADQVVTLEGTVVVDKDVGMGPRPVMLEDAKVLSN
jgi:hypothetical protein